MLFVPIRIKNVLKIKHVDCIKDLVELFKIGRVHVLFSIAIVCHSVVINLGDFALGVIKS